MSQRKGGLQVRLNATVCIGSIRSLAAMPDRKGTPLLQLRVVFRGFGATNLVARYSINSTTAPRTAAQGMSAS